jgi:hypothetical protein
MPLSVLDALSFTTTHMPVLFQFPPAYATGNHRSDEKREPPAVENPAALPAQELRCG